LADRSCWRCREPWNVMLEPDVGTADVRDWLEKEYGEGFEIRDVGGIAWGITRCPQCPLGAKLSTAVMNEDLNGLLD